MSSKHSDRLRERWADPDYRARQTAANRRQAEARRIGPRKALDNLADALVKDVLAMSDEEVLAEFEEDHGDPERHAAEMRALFERVVLREKLAALAHEQWSGWKRCQLLPAKAGSLYLLFRYSDTGATH